MTVVNTSAARESCETEASNSSNVSEGAVLRACAGREPAGAHRAQKSPFGVAMRVFAVNRV
jgi:hypothetical protein